MRGISKGRFGLVAVTVVVILTGVYLALSILRVRGAFSPMRPVREAGGVAVQLGGPGHRIVGRMYVSGTLAAAAPLVVVLHGDAPTRKPSYQYLFASQVSSAVPGTPVVAFLRPGYADPFGGKSDGDRGWFSAGENYTPEVIRDLSAALVELKSRFQASRLILVGHSGGATLTADIAAYNPGLVQNAVLVSCPCDVPAFRHHMAQEQHSPVWLLPVNAVSPLESLDRMDSRTHVVAISGTKDPIALPAYAEAYIARAQRRGIDAKMILLPGKEHEILLEPQVIQLVADLARQDFHASPVAQSTDRN